MFLKSFFSYQTTILFSLLHTYCFHHNLYHCTHIYMFHFCSHTLAVFITIALYHSSHILLHFTLLVTSFSFTYCSIGTFFAKLISSCSFFHAFHFSVFQFFCHIYVSATTHLHFPHLSFLFLSTFLFHISFFTHILVP